MGNYIVSARKYRPKGFDEVVGQEHITTTLKNAIEQDQLAQALLFCGPRGVGKTTCARIVANMINGFDKEKDFGSSTAMNIYELDAASNNSVDDIRNLIDQVRYPPQYGRYKVYIIDEVHMLSNQAFNAFLKTLEEPPSYAIFILATTEKHKVIPTILSRCQIFDFNRIDISDITSRLAMIAEKENIKADPEALHLLAQKADGALRDALSLFDLIVTYSTGNSITYKDTAENLHILDYDYYFSITDDFLNENLSGSLLTFNEILKEGFDGQNFIVGLAEHFRNLLVCRDKETVNLLEVSENVKKKYLEQSARADKSFLLSAINISNQCDINFKSSKNQRLHVEIALMKISHLRAALNLANVDSETKTLKKKQLTSERNGKQNSIGQAAKQKPEKTVKQQMPAPAREDRPELTQKSKKTIQIPTVEELNKQVGGEEEIHPVDQPDDEQVIRQKPITDEELSEVWLKFAGQLKEKGKNNEYNLMQQEITLKDNNLVTIHISNSLEEDILVRFRAELTNFLKENLNNQLIRVETELVKDNKSKIIYTNTDKFKFLSDKNPQLLELKKKFGLDTDF